MESQERISPEMDKGEQEYREEVEEYNIYHNSPTTNLKKTMKSILEIGSPDSDRDEFDAIIPEEMKNKLSKNSHVKFAEDGKSEERREEKLENSEDNNSKGLSHKEEKDDFNDTEIIFPSDQVDYYHSDDDLPSNWVKYFDEQYQCPYYLNTLTGVSQWEYPETDTFNQETRSPLMIDEGLENLKRFNEKNKKRAKSLSSVSIEWFGSEDFHEYISDTNSPKGRRHSEFLSGASPNLSSSPLSSLSYHLYQQQEAYEYRGVCNLDRKSSALEAGKQVKTSQDYLQMARLYKIQRPYSDPNYQALCLLCHKNYAEDVFFPCEHHCVCRRCIKEEKICEERQLSKLKDGYANCSLCAGVIKLILPLQGGREVEKYWDWVYEEKVQLPRSFMSNFKHSAAVIQAVYIDDKNHPHDSTHTTSTFCVIN